MSKKDKMVLKLIMIGNSGVGKSSLMNQFINKSFTSQYKATIGADFLTKEIEVDRETVALQIWDTAGHEKFMSFGQAFYRGSDCCFLVCDVTNELSFTALDSWKADFIAGANPPNVKDFPFVLLANKCDDDPDHRVGAREMLERWCENNNNIPFYEPAAKTGQNVDDAFLVVAQRVARTSTKTDT